MGIVSRSLGGGSGASALLFDSTLGAPANIIDTGANGIAQTQNVLEIWAIVRGDAAGVTDNCIFRLNSDSGANYDREFINGTNLTASASSAVAQTSLGGNIHGNGGGASFASILRITIPGYTQTTFFKSGEYTITFPDSTAANESVSVFAFSWRNTAAITRFSIAQNGAGNLMAGSRLLIYGR